MSGTFSREINGNLVSSKVTDVLFVNKDAEAQNLDDLSAILMKKMGAYSEVMGFHNSVIELSDVEDKETIRVGSQEASKETQRIGLNNELDAIDQEISLVNSQLNGLISNTEPSFIDSDNSSTINLAQGNGESSTLNNNQNKNSGENKSSNTQSSNQTQSNKTDNSISINSIRNSVNDLENQRTSVLARMTRLS
jgi:hypothetical protein